MSEFIEKSGRVDLRSYRPLRVDRGNGTYVALAESSDSSKYFSAYLRPGIPAEERVFLTAGEWDPEARDTNRPSGNRLLALKSLSLRGRFAQAVQQRAGQLVDPFLGVHFRNSDYVSDLDEVLAQVRKTIEVTGITRVYWCTDDSSSIPQARQRLPEAQISSFQNFAKENKRNLHYGLRGEDSIEHLANTFADLYTLSVAQEFIPSVGSWKRLVPLLRKKDPLRKSFFGLTER